MSFSSECYQIHQTLRQTMPHLSEARLRRLALCPLGTTTAQSGRRNAAISALAFMGGFSAVLQRLREWRATTAQTALANGERRRGHGFPLSRE